MRKVKKLKQEIEELREQRFQLINENAHLRITIMCDDEYRKELKKEVLCYQNKYIEEVQRNVALADIIDNLRQEFDDAESRGFI